MVQSHTSWNMWQFVGASQAGPGSTGAGRARRLRGLQGLARCGNTLPPSVCRKTGQTLKLSTQSVLGTKCLKGSVFLLTLWVFFIWLCVARFENSSRGSEGVLSTTKIIAWSVLNFWGEFSTSCPFFFFFPRLNIKVRISSHSLIKPPGFIHCIFAVAHWSIKSFLTNSI